MFQQPHLSALRPGARLNNYVIEAVLGAGGFGITYRAVEDVTGRKVAIKEYLPAAYAVRDHDGATVRPLSGGTAEDFAWGLDRFREEAKLLVDFRHPNIVPVLAYFEAHGTGYLVMAFEEGACLGDLLAQRGVLSEAETLRIVVPLLDGVEEVHRRGFLHRDIKPDNVFVRGDGTPVLLDFGAARQALGEHSKNLTALLTEGYAPFEQYAGSGNQGPWTDIYALAAVMFRCVVGKPPAAAPRRAGARLRNLRDPIAPELDEIRGRCGSNFAAAVAAGLAIVEHERPRSVGAFRDRLLGLPSTDASATAPTPSVTLVPDASIQAALRLDARAREERPPREARRRRKAVAIAAVLTVLLAAGATLYVGDDRSWLPGAVRSARTGEAPSTSPPAMPSAARREAPPAGTTAADTPISPEGMKALAEHQQRQLDQAEAERRAAESARQAEADRKRREETAAKEAEDRHAEEEDERQALEERLRRAEEERRRVEEERRARLKDERGPRQEGRERTGDRPPPRVAPAAPPSNAERIGRPPGNWPPELPDPRRIDPRHGQIDGPEEEGGLPARRARPPAGIDRPTLPDPDEY